MALRFGSLSSEQTDDWWSLTHRRAVFHQFPQAGMSLVGLLSLLPDENNDKPKFGWDEDYWEDAETLTDDLTASAGSAGPFAVTGSTTAAADPFTWTHDLEVRVYVTATQAYKFRIGDSIVIKSLVHSSTTDTVNMKITDLDTAAGGWIEVTNYGDTLTSVQNGAADNVGLTIYQLGSAYHEGAGSQVGGYREPLEVDNYTQIFREPIGPFTRTMSKAGVKYDSDGEVRNIMHQAAQRFMVGMEKALLWGNRLTCTVTDSNSYTKPLRFTGGVEYFIKQYELGNTGNGGAFNYRTGGADVTSSAWATTEAKRIVNLATSDGNTITGKDLENTILRRVFETGNNVESTKFAMCGNGALGAFNQFAKSNSLATRRLSTSEAFGLEVTQWDTLFGTVYFASHPLLNSKSAYRYSMYILDVGNIKYHYLNDSDMQLLENRQGNDEDERKDEWLAEAGFEVNIPPSHTIIHNMQEVI